MPISTAFVISLLLSTLWWRAEVRSNNYIASHLKVSKEKGSECVKIFLVSPYDLVI